MGPARGSPIVGAQTLTASAWQALPNIQNRHGGQRDIAGLGFRV